MQPVAKSPKRGCLFARRGCFFAKWGCFLEQPTTPDQATATGTKEHRVLVQAGKGRLVLGRHTGL